VKKVTYRAQQTVAGPAEIMGVGFLTGADVRLRFLPAPVDAGVAFIRTDLPAPVRIPARVEHVTGTRRRTTLGHAPHAIGLVEHVLAALAGLHIDNCLIEVNAPEPPGLDGSAQGFVDVLRATGTRLQAGRKAVYMPTSSVLVAHEGATLALHPSPRAELRISYLLDYGPLASIHRQRHTQTVTPESFVNELAATRTFLLEAEAEAFRRQGLGARTKISDLLVFGDRGLLHNELRYGNEPARHKVLDLVGDLSLFGHDLQGHVVAYRSGHPLNVELVRALARQLSMRQPVAA